MNEKYLLYILKKFIQDKTLKFDEDKMWSNMDGYDFNVIKEWLGGEEK